MALNQSSANGIAVQSATYNLSGSSQPILASASVFIATLVELRVLNNLLNSQYQNVDLNQMRADELNAVVPPGSL